MQSVSESSADLTAVAAVTGAAQTSSKFEGKVPCGDAVSSEAGAVQDEQSSAGNRRQRDDTAMAGEDKGNQNEAIIAALEDWAAWERELEKKELEKEAEKNDIARDIKDIADVPAPPLVENDTLQRDPKSSSQCIVAEFDDSEPVQITPFPRRVIRSASTAFRATTGHVFPRRRDRRRAERNDPLARTRREALKVWAADQTRRRSSAGDSALDLGQVDAGLTLKDWAVRRGSSAEATVDQARKGGRSRQEHWKGRTAGPLHTSAPPDSRHRPSPLAKESPIATDKTVSRWRGLHPGRAGRGRPEKQGRPAPDGTQLWEGDAQTDPPTPRTPGSVVAGRASPWARSPSRETAGGILVKHCFFYGPAGKIAVRRSPNTAPSFESHWMRKFREEVQGNPNWWAGQGPYRPGGSSEISRRSVFGRTGSSRRPSYPLRTGASISNEKGGASRNTNLWDEVRSLLARSRRSDGTDLAGGGSSGDADDGAATREGVDALSFGDRLRCTPLSQGAWLVDSAGGERSSSVGSWRDGDRAAIILEEKARGGFTKAPGRVHTSSEMLVAARAAVDHASVSDNAHPRGKGSLSAGERGSGTSVDDMGNGGQQKNLQSVHEAILAKLRGEIDPFTREEIVLRAAEDAKGALARDQAHTPSPRRTSAGAHRLPSSGKEDPAPAPIDYDKVEATLSLIELASRAAGPDAGKQMLQALEGLDKIHQRVSDDEIAGGKRDCASEDKADLQAESAGVDGSDKGLTTAEASGGRPRDELTHAQNLPGNKHGFPAEVSGKEKGPHQSSRRISLAVSAVSDVSDDNLGSTSTGVIQSIGNWLRGADRPPSRQHSFASATPDRDGDTQRQVRGREGFPSPLATDLGEQMRGGIEARNAEETKPKEEGREEEEASRARHVSITAQQSNEVDDRTPLDPTSRVGVQATDDEQREPGNASPGTSRGNSAKMTGVESVPTPKIEALTAESDGRIHERPIETHSASQADKAVSPESPPSPLKAVDARKSESPRRLTALRERVETHHSRVVSPERRREHTSGTGREKPHLTTANTTVMRETVVEAQRVGRSLKDSCHRDSWVSLGTRPKRGGDGQEHKPVPEGARIAADLKLFGYGRPRAKNTAATGTCAIAAGIGEPIASGVPSKVCAKFVWPRPGRSVSGKPVNLPEATRSKSSLGKAPGIVRRSPLIDALHPAVAKQRAFRLTLRKAGQPDVPPPMATEESKSVHASEEITTRKRHDIVKACGPVSNSIVGKASTRRRERRPLSSAAPSSVPAPATQHSRPPPLPVASTRRRESRPLPSTPPSAAPSPPTQHSRQSPLPMGPQPSVGEEPGSGIENTSADVVAPAVRLTFLQCGCIAEWMARAKDSLGPRVWECLGSSPAFYRIRDRLRGSLVPAVACEMVDESDQPLGHVRPVRARKPENKLVVKSATRESEVVSGPTSRKGEGRRVETDNKGEEHLSWGDHLSQQAALVVDAIMWAVATERERSTVCAAILQDRKIRSERPGISALGAGHGGGDTRGEDNADSSPTETTLAVSWLRARRFAKTSPLVDGVSVVDADVDLAFKRWEASEQAGRPALITTTSGTCSPSRSGPVPPVSGMCAAVNPARVRSSDAAATPRMCDAVGCSEGGRYGDICPMEKTRFCRKHRNDGMVDLGGRRCERAGCGRLAARKNTLVPTKRGALCSLHTQEDRVDLEGFAFVLLALAEARQRGVRRLAAMAGGTAGKKLAEMGEEAADTAVLNALAVRDLVLALTNQPLPEALPNVMQESLQGIEALKDAIQPSSVSQPTLSVAPRPVGGAVVFEAATDRFLRPNGSGRLSGNERTPDQVREYRGVPNSDEIAAADYHSAAVAGSPPPPPPPDRHPSARAGSWSQSLSGVDNESSFRNPCMSKSGKLLQPHEAEAHREGQREPEEPGCRSEEGKRDECLQRQARGSRLRSAFDDDGNGEFRELWPQSLNASRAGHGDCAHRSSPTGATPGEIRLRGVDEVLGRNARALKAVFRRYSRRSGDTREMALPDVLRFCDAFELRPGLVSTREIVDGFKEVIYPGVMGLTDEEIGYSLKSHQRRPSTAPTRSGLIRQAAFTPVGIECASRQNGGYVGGEAIAPADPAAATAVPDSVEAGEGGDDYCADFPSDIRGDDRVRSPSRHTNTTSGGAGGRGKTKAVYLGRAQKYPLRRVESTIASGDLDFGLTGGSADSSAGRGVRRRASFRSSSLGRTGSHYLGKNAVCDLVDGEHEAIDPPVAPGLSLLKFLEWMSEVAVKCPTPSKTFGKAFARLPNEQRPGRWGNGRSGPLLERTGRTRGAGNNKSRQNAAKAVVMLQWMELSRGMRNGGIPPFNLSSCFAEAAPPSVGCSDRR